MINPDTKQESWRLNKFVALCLGVSRRKADELIEKGKITIDGQPARLGQQISDANKISYDGKLLGLQPKQLIILHKPTGYLCSRAFSRWSSDNLQIATKKPSPLKTCWSPR